MMNSFQENEEMINKTIQDREKELSQLWKIWQYHSDEEKTTKNENTDLLKEILKSQIKMIELLSEIKQDNIILIEKTNYQNHDSDMKKLIEKVDKITNEIEEIKQKKSRKIKDHKL